MLKRRNEQPRCWHRRVAIKIWAHFCGAKTALSATICCANKICYANSAAIACAVVCALLFYAMPCAAQTAQTAPSVSVADGEYVDAGDAGGITVTASRRPKRLKDTSVPVEVITNAEIEASSAATVVDVLNSFGLVSKSTMDGDSIMLQGFGKDKVLVLINGRRLTGRHSQILDGATLPLANVERIEVVRGPQSALYGSDALGGVINIITKKPDGNISVSGSLTNRFLPHSDFDPAREQLFEAAVSFPAGALYNIVDIEAARGSFYDNEDKSEHLLPQYRRGRLGWTGSVDFDGGKALNTGLSAMFLSQDGPTRPSRDGSDPNPHFDYIRAEGDISFSMRPFEGARLNFSLNDNYYRRSKKSNGTFDSENLAAFLAMGTYEGFTDWIFTTGLEASFNSLEKENLSRDFVRRDKEALFFEAEYVKPSRYSLSGGFRLERDSNFGFAAAPKLSAMRYFGKYFRILGGAGLGYRAPDFDDLYMDVAISSRTHRYGSESLKPEYSAGLNAAAEFSGAAGFIHLNAYYTELWDEIAYGVPEKINGVSTAWKENKNRTFRAGADAQGRINLPFNFFAGAGYSRLFAWDRGLGGRFYPAAEHTVTGKTGFENKKICVSLAVRYFSHPHETGTYSESGERIILDFYSSFTLSKNWQINFSIDNIAGVIDELGPRVPQIFSVGLRYRS